MNGLNAGISRSSGQGPLTHLPRASVHSRGRRVFPRVPYDPREATRPA